MKSSKAHILLVESNHQDIDLTMRAFKAHDIESPIHVAYDGKSALDMLQGRGMPALYPTPSIILLNLDLPKMDGLQFLKELRQDNHLRSCSVFVITENASKKDIAEAYNLNVAGYILKPIQSDTFLETIATLHSYWSLIELPN